MTSNEAVVLVIERLEDSGVPYLIVGSFASNMYGVSRATKDADIVIELRSHSLGSILKGLPVEFRLDPQITFESVTGTTRHLLDVANIPFRIEFFRLSDDLHDQERFRRRIRIFSPALGREIVVPTPEDVIVTKLRWAQNAARGKDRDDVKDVIVVQGDAIDWSYVHGWCDRHGTRALLDEIRATIPPGI